METLDEYLKLPKSKQDELKDVGGFVAGALKGNRRKANNVLTRDVITLDIEGLNGQPALVFYNFQHDLARIKKALSRSGLVIRELKGPKDEDDWNARKIDILLAHPASAAYGLNLQKGGNHVIWFGLNWSLELYQQANKRLHRQG